jgi:peroxiredoxin
MRTLLFLFLFVANTVAAQHNVTLSGNIKNKLSDTVTVTYNDNKLAYYPKTYYGLVDKKGNFSFSFPLLPGMYTQVEIRHEKRLAEVMLQPGDSLYMAVNAAHFDSSISYKGRGSEVQNFIARHTVDKGRMNQYTLKVRNQVINEPAEYLKKMEQEKEAELSFLETYKAGLPPSFIAYWKGYYTYYNYFFMQQYPQMHEIWRLGRYTDSIPKENYTVVKEIPYVFSDTMLQVPSYLLYLTGIFNSKLKAAGMGYPNTDTTQTKKLQDSVYKLAYKMLPNKSAEYYLAQDLYGRAKFQHIATTRSQFARFKKNWPESEYLPLLEKQVGMAERVAPGQPAPDFDIITPEGTHMKLSDLRGKVVYLTFWAAWCRQCVGEMLSERKTKEYLKNKEVAFVNVSIDYDTSIAQSVLRKYKVDGIFTYKEGEWNAKEIQDYGVQGLPAYFLIDTEGKFAYQAAPTPANATELLVAISKLLPEKK